MVGRGRRRGGRLRLCPTPASYKDFGMSSLLAVVRWVGCHGNHTISAMASCILWFMNYPLHPKFALLYGDF